MSGSLRAISYAPAGPIATPPVSPYAEAEERREAVLDALAGLELGAYDLRIVEWFVNLDDSTLRVLVSWLLRVRAAGGAQ